MLQKSLLSDPIRLQELTIASPCCPTEGRGGSWAERPWWGLSDTMEALLAEHLFSGGLTEQNWAFLLTSPALGSPGGENVGVEAK